MVRVLPLPSCTTALANTGLPRARVGVPGISRLGSLDRSALVLDGLVRLEVRLFRKLTQAALPPRALIRAWMLNGTIGVYWADVPSTNPSEVPGVKPGSH